LTMSVDLVLQRASGMVTPSRAEVVRLERIASKVRSLLETAFQKSAGVNPEISLGGSYAKGTWLKGSADIDYFLLFPSTYSRESLENEAIERCKLALSGHKIEMRFAEHPYVESFIEGVRVNLVPCYKVERGNWQSAADRSPYHARYIRERFNDEMKLEARLLKKFAKSSQVYGAEVKMQGFSGYVCEVLTLKFGNFKNVLDNLCKSSFGRVISVEEYDKELAASFKSALVILDPVDTTRNLGSAISTENVAKLVLRSRRFLSRPSISFFLEDERNRGTAGASPSRDLLSRTIIVTFRNDERSVDILWGQLKKSVRSLSSKLEDSGFNVLREKAVSDEKGESAFLFLLQEIKISDLQVRLGPEYFRQAEVEKYLAKNGGRSKLVWINDEGRFISLGEREGSNALAFLRESLSDKTRLEKLGLSKAIKEEISQSHRITLASGNVKSKPWLREGLRQLLSFE